MHEIIDGKSVARSIRSRLKEQVAAFTAEHGEIGLAVVLVGDDPASQIYVRNKIKACEETGIRSHAFYLPQNVGQKQLNELISSLAENEKVHGILLQLPLPQGLDEKEAATLIPTEKDVDGFSAENLGKLAMNEESFVACTPNGVMQLLSAYDIPIAGKHAVVVGRSNIVGKPMALLLTNADATVTLCHSKTKNLQEICRQADILIAAVGKPSFVTADMVKEGAVVIDVGIHRLPQGKMCGDVDFDSVKEKASYITPVPGGVGPMTITMLLYNTYIAAKRSIATVDRL